MGAMYESWKARCEAEVIVPALFEDLAWRDDVIERLQSDMTMSAWVRQAAVHLARKWPASPRQLNARAWPLVVRPGRDIDDYCSALRMAETASELAPDAGNILNTLGVAQYRVGEHRAALETLRRSDEVNSKREPGGIPADVAFLAMSLHQLGRTEEARTVLERLCSLTQNERWASDEDAQAFLREAEELIRGTVPTDSQAAQDE